ncbi:MAG: sulfite exporter TauE/SafE family protein, partial [Patescibacteria group bacterium]
VLIIGKLLSRLGLLSPNVGLFNSSSLGAVFVLGLVVASSSCLAVAGGLLLSSVKTFRERYQSVTVLGRLAPVLLFVGGRVVGYGLLGGIIGWLGKSLTPSPVVTGVITMAAAVYMLVMGLDMLNLAPQWLKRLKPRMPKRLGHAIMNAEGHQHILMPAVLGAGTFFLPCGFTQALQLYALTTGSFWTSAVLLAVFALGTAPALIGLGWASSSFSGKLGQMFFRLAGATVIVLGIWNLQNGLTVAGYPLRWPSWTSSSIVSTEGVTYDGRTQVMKMSADVAGYSPNSFTLRQGVPTRWEIDASSTAGCIRVLQAPRLGIRNQLLKDNQTNIIEFTPQTVGTFAFSCSMGMYRGQIVVVPNS